MGGHGNLERGGRGIGGDTGGCGLGFNEKISMFSISKHHSEEHSNHLIMQRQCKSGSKHKYVFLSSIKFSHL